MDDNEEQQPTHIEEEPTNQPMQGQEQTESDDADQLLEAAFIYKTKKKYPEGAGESRKRVIRKKAAKFEVVNGEMNYKMMKQNEEVLLRYVACLDERKKILHSCHVDPTAGHMGKTRTISKIKERFMWKGIVKDVQEMIRSCDVCQRMNRKLTTGTPQLHPIAVKEPWYMIGIDFVGPISPTASDGSRYILTVSDYFTKWVEALPTQDKCATTVASSLFKIFMRFGIPQVVLSDQGSEFNNQVDANLCSLLNIHRRLSTPYHPQCNGLDERFNQTLQTMLVKYVHERKEEWSNFLDTCVFAYNTSRQESSKFSPFELMFSRKATIPIDIELRKEESEQLAIKFKDLPEADHKELEERRKTLLDEAKKNIVSAQKKQKELYDKKHAKPHLFEVGQQVLKRDFTRKKRKGGKLDEKFLGPYQIESALGNGTYILSDPKKPNSKIQATGAHLKPYVSTGSPPGDSTSPQPLHSTRPDRAICTFENLERQMWDDSLLRLWRTGSLNCVWLSEDDVFDPTDYIQHEEEYALSKDVDVEVWVHYRSYTKQSLPKDAFDFVIVTNELHDDFDAFKKKELPSRSSLLVITDLLQFYLHCCPHLNPPCLHRYGNRYYQFSLSQMDDLCSWVIDMRTTFSSNIPQLTTFLQDDPPPPPLRDQTDPPLSSLSTVFPVGKPQSITANSVRGSQTKARTTISGSRTVNKGAKCLIKHLKHPHRQRHKRKVISIDNQPPSQQRKRQRRVEHTQWVDGLITADKELILSNTGWLNSNIISAAQRLLKKKSPVGGLQDTSCGITCGYYIEQAKFVQILHNGVDHWLTVSTIGARDGEVFVFDSLYQSVSDEVKNQIAAILALSSPSIQLNFVSVQKQSGGYDCGVFAIAFATSLALGYNPGSLTFKQNEMRKHLYYCLAHGELTMFPGTVTRDATITSHDTINVYCSCRMPEISGIAMVQCSNPICNEWYHISCVKVPKSALNDSQLPWLCPLCSE